MTKRVKPGYDELLHGQVRAHEHKGDLLLRQRGPSNCEDVVTLTAEACQALGMTTALEDVPEPWERVRDAVLAVAVVLEFEGPGRHRLHMTEDGWRKVAADLRLKPEGES